MGRAMNPTDPSIPRAWSAPDLIGSCVPGAAVWATGHEPSLAVLLSISTLICLLCFRFLERRQFAELVRDVQGSLGPGVSADVTVSSGGIRIRFDSLNYTEVDATNLDDAD